MRRDIRHDRNVAGGILRRLAAERKKGAIAVCLIAIMGFMWIRVLTQGSPEAAGAAPITNEVEAVGESDSAVKITFIELPQIDGRNDVITRDVFDPNGWQKFDRDVDQTNQAGIEEVGVVSTDVREEMIARVTKKLKLQAVVMGESHQAFINETLVSVGDKIPVRDGSDLYECEVVEIGENAVLLKCEETEITMRLLQAEQEAD